MMYTNRTRDTYNNVQSTANNTNTTSAIGEKKRLKVQFIQNNPNTPNNNLNLLINNKNWPNLKVYDIIEIAANSNSQPPNNNTNNSMNRSVNYLNSSIISNSVITNTNLNQINNYHAQQSNSGEQDESSPILLQVLPGSLTDQIPMDSIRIDQIASSAPFSFKAFNWVNVTVVDKANVVLDLVELLFREQYLNGNDMLRIKKHMVNTCVYLKKNIEFCGMRCSVKQMWAPNCDVVTCGYISEKTRLVFRSQSAMCTIYIQMSREMWEFDVNGEMYHEKAVNFLGELFTNWKNQSCSHDVTIALFSRIFYDAKSLDDFPISLSRHIKKDHKNRFYEDFYRVIYQNERFEDWTPTLVILKRLIKEYRDYILNYHKRQFGTGLKMPNGMLSSAAEGNFLETLILSSNVFERHFIDRPFDRTGMMSLVITPGNGLFEVSRELSKITKERVIDNAIGSDLVCLGEQPLHSVPLFKYETPDTYEIPHWINLSFYKSSETVRYCNSKFLPSSKIKFKFKSNGLADSNSILPGYSPDKNDYVRALEDTDNMFANTRSSSSLEMLNNQSKTTIQNNKMASRVNTQPNFQTSLSQAQLNNQSNSLNRTKMKRNQTSSNYSVESPNNNKRTISTGNQEDSQSAKQEDDQFSDEDDGSSLEFDSDSEQTSAIVTSSGETKRIKSKVNPFAPSSVKAKMSFERRRWAHTFPLRNDGTPIYQHWTVQESMSTAPPSRPVNSIANTNFHSEANLEIVNKVSPDSGNKVNRTGKENNKLYISNKNQMNKMDVNWDEKTELMRPGVAWKSLTTPACLPLTTDFFPHSQTWNNHFIQSGNYCLLLDEIREQYGYSNCTYNKISMEQVFTDLVGHRLAMGFQMVVPKNTFTYNSGKELNSNFICDLASSTSVTARTQANLIQGYYKLSLGRIYHELFYINDKSGFDYIKVEIYMPEKKTKKDGKEILYTYRFQVPDSKTYDISYVKMTRKNTESVKWNLIDSYICIQGNGSLTPSELKKCWRQRIYLVPVLYVPTNRANAIKLGTNNLISDQQLQPTSPNTIASKTSLNNHFENTNLNSSHFIFNVQTPGVIPASMADMLDTPVYCDIYQRKSEEELKFYRDYYFIKFMEGLNKLNRADDRRCYSRSAISYAEALSSNPSDQCIAITILQSMITSQLYGTNTSSMSSTNKLISSSSSGTKMSSQQLPSLTPKVQNFRKLTSPKLKLYPLVNKYLAETTSSVQNDALKSEIINYLNQEYIPDMVNKQHGIPFIENKKDIPLNCFVSAESVWWCIEHITDVETEPDAIIFMQIMCDFFLIKHISNQQKLFIHGFYLYYIITPESRGHHLYTKDYCEVGFADLDCIKSTKLRSTDSKPNLPLSATEIFKSYPNIFKAYSRSEFSNESPDSILKLVNVDVDPARKSNRVEWASAVYRSHYHQLCAFELEIQWEMATGQLLSELVSGWSKLANRFNYNIVAAPIDPFALPIVPNSDPLRGPIIIKLNYSCLIQNESYLFENFIDQKYKLDYSLLMTSENDSSSSFPSSIPANTIYEQLVQCNPEFMEYLVKKYPDSSVEKSKEKIERKISEENDFIEQEFQEFIERKRIYRLQNFQEAILEKYGFVRNASVVKSLDSDDDPTFFIHSSGGMFVCLPNYYGNYYTSRSRHTSSNSTNSITTTTSSTVSKTLSRLNDLERNRSIDTNKLNEDNLILSPPVNHLTDTKYTNSRSDLKVNSNGFNSPMSHSYTTSNATNTNMSSTSQTNGYTPRERSNTKSQHVQFLKLNEKNYLNGTTASENEDFSDKQSIQSSGTLDSGIDSYKKTIRTDDEFKSDLLFKPTAAYDIRQSNKSNEKLDLIQQQQREQMLMQSLSTTPNNTTLLSESNQFDNTTKSNESNFVNNVNSSSESTLNREVKKLPFYNEPDTYIGFSWSWNFMLGKKWRSQYTGDETLQDNMLSDFRLFCSNKDGRLLKFYNESKDLL